MCDQDPCRHAERFLELIDREQYRVNRARQGVVRALRSRRVCVAAAMMTGLHKGTLAHRLGISRPTLDTWLAQVAERPDEVAEATRLVAEIEGQG